MHCVNQHAAAFRSTANSMYPRPKGRTMLIYEGKWGINVKANLPLYVACPRSSCSRLEEEWDVKWWRIPPALLTLQDPDDFQ